jgi:glycerol-3-phosphate dehydrogenase (NAD(P)+)
VYKNVSILGAGSWGMGVAKLLQENGLEVKLWEYNESDYQIIKDQRCHPKKLRNIFLHKTIDVTNDLEYAIENIDLLVSAVPSQSLRSVLDIIPKNKVSNCPIVNLAKGIETTTLKRMSEVIIEKLGHPSELVTTLSGPSHAEEVTADIPTAVVIAGENNNLLTDLQKTFSSNTFRAYQSSDLIGVELGGSLKNIIAIAAGICAGLKQGDNTLGALVTRGLAEMSRLGIVMGAKAETFAGLSGIGDLITTCASVHSRNRYVGEHIGMGEKLNTILTSMAMVAEGVQTTKSGYTLAKKYKVEMPITNEVYEVLFNDKPPDVAVGDLMKRELKSENWN